MNCCCGLSQQIPSLISIGRGRAVKDSFRLPSLNALATFTVLHIILSIEVLVSSRDDLGRQNKTILKGGFYVKIKNFFAPGWPINGADSRKNTLKIYKYTVRV